MLHWSSSTATLPTRLAFGRDLRGANGLAGRVRPAGKSYYVVPVVPPDERAAQRWSLSLEEKEVLSAHLFENRK